MRILITGGAGFIGSSLVESLMSSGTDSIFVLDNLSTGREENICHWYGHPSFRFTEADMLNSSLLEKAVDSCEMVYHMAANPIVSLGQTNTEIDFRQNVCATYNLLEAMRKSKSCKRIVFSSTSAVYGEASTFPTPEQYSPLAPISLYGATKLACEALISGYSHMYNFSSLIFRFANIIGPRSTHGVVYDFVSKLKANPNNLEILGDGKQNKSYLYVDDCVNAILQLQRINNKIFDVFNVGSEDQIRVLDIYAIVAEELFLENTSIQFEASMDGRGWKGDVKEYLLDISKIKDYGWRPSRTSAEAVRLTTRILSTTTSA